MSERHIKAERSERINRRHCRLEPNSETFSNFFRTYVGPVAVKEQENQGAAGNAQPALALPDKPSLAVLPFTNLSGDPEQQYFADGMVEDIITGLSRIKWLFVIARNSSAAIRHARAALSYGRDDATALALGGCVISIIEHDRATAFEAVEQALAISPSSSFALFCGATALAYAGEAERGIDWAERALRISPFDRMNHLSYGALAIAHFLRGRYDEAAHAGRRAVRAIPSSSVIRSVLAAALAKLGHIEEAKAVGLQVLALDPSFSAARFCAATGLPTPLAEAMTDAWTTAGLPP
jgi:tetratricopeptide (TPR) repeat protein